MASKSTASTKAFALATGLSVLILASCQERTPLRPTPEGPKDVGGLVLPREEPKAEPEAVITAERDAEVREEPAPVVVVPEAVPPEAVTPPEAEAADVTAPVAEAPEEPRPWLRDVYSDGPDRAPKPSWPPEGQRVRVEITANEWFSKMGDERSTSAGRANVGKIKGQQENILYDAAGLANLRGKVVTGALLHFAPVNPVEEKHHGPAYRVGVSTVSAPWREGPATSSYTRVEGEACWNQAQLGVRDWAYPGSTIMDVVNGRGHTIWRFADATRPDAKGYQSVAVDPRVVQARVAGISHGFCITDEVGNIWSDTGGEFTWFTFPNRQIYSRHSNRQPWLEVWVADEDRTPPEAIADVRVVTDNLPAGEAVISWTTPRDEGAGTIGYNASLAVRGRNISIPRYLVPTSGLPGTECRMHLQDLQLPAGQAVTLALAPIDGAGNVGPELRQTFHVSAEPGTLDFGPAPVKPFAPRAARLGVGGVAVSVIDLMDKVDPVSGAMNPGQADGYFGGNHIFSSTEKRVRLFGARNEHVSFQVNLHGQAESIKLGLSFPEEADLAHQMHEFAYVKLMKDNQVVGYAPDPLLPTDGTVSIPSKAGRVEVPGQTNHSVICEIYIPHDIDPGVKKGTLTVSAGGRTLSVSVDLTVWNFTLPNTLSFIPEMNSYQTSPFPAAWHRLAHEHRTMINQLWYPWSCSPGISLPWDGHNLVMSEFDRSIGPMLDGTMFKGLPRDSEPLPVLYLPFNEGWPVRATSHFKASYWADEAFTDEYRDQMKLAISAFARHCDERGYHDTLFHYYLNNKSYNRNRNRQNQAPWIFDEPVNTQDFWALRWYMLVFKDAVRDAAGEAKFITRADVSYGQHGRDMLWGAMDWDCVGGSSDQKVRMKKDEWVLWGRNYFTEYGTSNSIDAPNIQPAAWILKAFSNGGSGVLPWQTIGRDRSWEEADQLSVFYPDDGGNIARPSVRLKAYRRGQQDVEYMTLLSHVEQVPIWRVQAGLLKAIDLSANVMRTHELDAGTIGFRGASPLNMWETRIRVARMVDAKAPPYQAKLVDWSVPEDSGLPNIGYATVAPPVEAVGPRADTFR